VISRSRANEEVVVTSPLREMGSYGHVEFEGWQGIVELSEVRRVHTRHGAEGGCRQNIVYVKHRTEGKLVFGVR
jgi:hypothetical protein